MPSSTCRARTWRRRTRSGPRCSAGRSGTRGQGIRSSRRSCPPTARRTPTCSASTGRRGSTSTSSAMIDRDTARLEGLGASRGYRAAAWQVLASPAGLPFCVCEETWPHERPTAVAWPGGHRSRLVQLTVDVPADRYDLELEFWRAATDWADEDVDAPEFHRLVHRRAEPPPAAGPAARGRTTAPSRPAPTWTSARTTSTPRSSASDRSAPACSGRAMASSRSATPSACRSASPATTPTR